jgi:hypothetical protein
MGAKISGAGTSEIKIVGVKRLGKAYIEVIPDRIEAGTYVIAGALLGNNLRVENIIPDHIEALTLKLKEMGFKMDIGSDYIEINEDNITDFVEKEKIHLIKMNFEEPTEELIMKTLELYPNTNRFVISNNIKLYNDVLKNTPKKYYIENTENTKIITFFKKNNKVLFNFNNVNKKVKEFLLDNFLFDILKNVEVIVIDKNSYINKETVLQN